MGNSLLSLLAQTEGVNTVQLVQFNQQPVHVFVPTGYEMNYAYPLIVLLHGEGGNAEQTIRYAQRISRRNCFCLALKGPKDLGTLNEDCRPMFGWGEPGEMDGWLRDYMMAALQYVRSNYHVHSERVFLAGLHEGATIAYRIGLQMPHALGGIIALNGSLPRPEMIPSTTADLSQLRVLIAHGAANERIPMETARQDYLALYGAGVDVTLNTYPTTHQIHNNMWRDLNRWIMHNVTVDSAFDAQDEDFDD